MGCREQFASGSTASSTLALLVIEPVCQCSNCLPVVNIMGYSASGTSSGAMIDAGVNFPLPSKRGKPSPNTIDCPGSVGDKLG